MKIPGYTIHGDYYLADKVIPNKTWEEACKMKEMITLPNGKTVIAHTLSKEELKSIPLKERKISENGHYWYWASTPYNGNYAWLVLPNGGFYNVNVTCNGGNGGARLGFYKNEIKQLLGIE